VSHLKVKLWACISQPRIVQNRFECGCKYWRLFQDANAQATFGRVYVMSCVMGTRLMSWCHGDVMGTRLMTEVWRIGCGVCVPFSLTCKYNDIMKDKARATRPMERSTQK